MSTRFVRCVALALVLGVVMIPAPGSTFAAPAAQAPMPAPEEGPDTSMALAVPTETEQYVAGDMVVEWIDGAPDGETEQATFSDAPSDLTVPATGEVAHASGHADEAGYDAASIQDRNGSSEHHAAASGGYALFSETARWIPSGYTIRLTGSDRRIEQYRDELARAARAATALTGVPIRVAAGFGGPVEPGRGEIAVALGSGSCGSGAVGCGGPRLTQREVVSGRVWVHQTGLGLTADQRANLAAHELGHALGLKHFDGSWNDGRQVMYHTITGTPSFRSGDGAGLRRLSGADDQPAGTVASRSYAAGRAHVTGTVATGSRIRITSASAVADVAVSGGRFSGSIPLPAGSHVVCVTSLDPAPGFRADLGCGPVDAPGTPHGQLDDVEQSVRGIRVQGWALDPQTTEPVQVQIIRNGVVLKTVRADQHRNDLGDAAHHYGTGHGFSANVAAEPGRNAVCVRAIGVGAGGDGDVGCLQVHHAGSAPETGTTPTAGNGPVVSESPVAPVVEAAGPASTVVKDLLAGVTKVASAPVPLVADLRDGLLER